MDRAEGSFSDAARPWLRGRWAAIALIAGLVIAIGGTAAVAYRLTTAEDAPAVTRHADPLADLLGWLPATDATRRTFAVWVDEGVVGATPPAAMDVRMQGALGLAPVPRTLGAAPGWRDAFGWAAGDVTAWATAGDAGVGISVLAGAFDPEAVRNALTAGGYQARTYRGVSVYVLHAVATPGPTIDGAAAADANAVALLADRLITAAAESDVRAAIDATFGDGPSLATDPAVAGLIQTAGPSAALAATDAADLASVCAANDPTARATTGAPSGRYVATAYGRSPADGRRQTTVLVAVGAGPAAQEAADAWRYGWVEAVVALGAVTSPASSYATLAAAGATADTLVARFVDGRVDGWAPLALRLASPVCLAVADLSPAAPPPPAPPATAAARRAIALSTLPDAGEQGTFAYVDLAATSAARGVAAPTAPGGEAPVVEQVAAWSEALVPLPNLTILPATAEGLAQVPVVLGIGLDELALAAEAGAIDPAGTVGLLIGTWDPARVHAALQAAGYDWIPRGAAVVFAAPMGATMPSWAPPAWTNLGLVGDRLFLSPSSQALRAAVDGAVVSSGSSPVSSDRADLLALAPEATSGFVVGGEAARRDCAARGITGHAPAWRALAAVWTATAGGDQAAVVAAAAANVSPRTLAAEVDEWIGRLRLVASTDDGSTTDVGPPLVDAFTYAGTRLAESSSGDSAVAEFAIAAGAPTASGFYATTDSGCAFATRP